MLELSDELTKAGFDVLAAGAFAGEHSYLKDELPVAARLPKKVNRLAAETLGKCFHDLVIKYLESTA
ncbi:MAG: hypothetical protein ACOC2V_03505 [Alkalispirochaeta sp.]